LIRVDPEVSRLKFELEINRLAEQQSALQARGIFVLGSPTYPVVELLIVPRHSLQVPVAAPQPGNIDRPPGVPPEAITLAVAEVPSLSARAFKAHFDLTDYDLRAPSLEFRDPWTDALLTYGTMFRALEYEKQRQAHLVLLDDHPTTHKPFLCLRGIREYHEHPQHSGDDWLLYRTQMSLFSITMSLWRVSVDLIHPMLLPHPSGLQVQWNAEEKA
jgi:putative metal binding uncharacterized protein